MSYDSVGPRPPKLRGQQYLRAHLLVPKLVIRSQSILQGIVTSSIHNTKVSTMARLSNVNEVFTQRWDANPNLLKYTDVTIGRKVFRVSIFLCPLKRNCSQAGLGLPLTKVKAHVTLKAPLCRRIAPKSSQKTAHWHHHRL
jgi:hypothetical protein